MNPIELTTQLNSALIQYLLTTFDVNRDGKNAGLRAGMHEAFKRDGALFSGPFLELSLPYRRGKSINQLVDDGVLSAGMRTLKNPPIPLDAPLYLHQQRAIERIADGNSVIVSSGTGSGKTESFLIPILNDLLRDRSPGVRAVLIYPLNALVNDQLDRLRKLLAGTGILFGRYTSELASTDAEARTQFRDEKVIEEEVISREAIRKDGKLPQILITNYAMLEYLLLRPEDTPLFSKPQAWKFIVLDEAHSYAGAKGVEVAYLIRRLKQRLGKAESGMCCIGTSATLTDDATVASRFANTLFGEVFGADDIIFGEHEMAEVGAANQEPLPPISMYLENAFEDLLAKLRGPEPAVQQVRESLESIGLVRSGASLDMQDVKGLLYSVLKDNPHLIRLREAVVAKRDNPLDLHEAAQTVFANDGTRADDPQHLNALYRLIELSNYARDENGEALLPVRYHVFARSPQGLWACINSKCAGRPEGHKEPWSRLFSSPRLTCDSCGTAVFPLVVCRTCGQVYLRTAYADDRYKSERLNEEEVRYFAWSAIEANTALKESDADDDEETRREKDRNYPIAANAIHLCLNDGCRRDSRCECKTPARVALFPIERKQTGDGRSRTQWENELKQCARCHSVSRIKTDEIATPITTSGSTPLSVLTMALYRRLPESAELEASKKPGNGRKLLTFYDSRQGAARYAAFLQDVHNQDVYRYLVPRALEESEDDVDLKDLASICARIGWDDLQVFQNALDEDLAKNGKGGDSNRYPPFGKLTNSKRKRLETRILARILAEITISRRGRQSMEALGLIRVRYFETEPDVTTIAETIGLNAQQTRQLIDALLDTLRDEKAITLPNGISADDSVFGKHTGNPYVVRANAQKGEVPWIGVTERHRRCRIMLAALRSAARPATFEDVKTALEAIWDWLISDQNRVLNGSGERRHLDTDSIFLDAPKDGWSRCKVCQRLRYGDQELPCAYPDCGGEYTRVDRDAIEQENYYYSVLSHTLYPMRVEEHTAQLSPEQGRRYQEQFKRGDINILSCSTTFEMGIDLGDLQTVVMNNVPPNVSNYRQRAGRAGRRTGGTAFIVTWANDRPHDQTYFTNPPAMIRGHVRIPRIELNNAEIRRRHMNAVLLAYFLRYLKSSGREAWNKVGAFFDPQAADGAHYARLDLWLQSKESDLQQVISDFVPMLKEGSPEYRSVVDQFRKDLEKAKKRYDEAAQYYQKQIELAVEQYSRGEKQDDADKQRKQFQGLLKRLNDTDLIEMLSDKGALPGYSFPIYSVELELPWREQEARNQLRLQRDLRQAIAEYAPGSEVVADKRLWTSGGVRILGDAPQVYSYRLCPKCNHLHGATTAGEAPVTEQSCPVCHEHYLPNMLNARYLVPDGFRATPDSGKSAGQYVHREPSQQSVAVTIPETPTSEDSVTGWAELKYKRHGKLFYLNQGPSGRGYRLCLKCGSSVTGSKSECTTPNCTGDVQSVHLGHHVDTDTLAVQFNPPLGAPLRSQHDMVFWYTLQTALVLGATRALQIEREDIGGTLFPLSAGNDWKQSLVLYDNVPGGAGYMRDIEEHFEQVVNEALRVVHCESCTEDTSCTRCLRDYGNQAHYDKLKRGEVIPFLEQLSASFETQPHPLGETRLIANNPLHVLMEKMQSATQSIRLAVHSISDDVPPGEMQSWLDILKARLRAGLEVQILMQEPPVPARDDAQATGLAGSLLSLMSIGEKGLQLYRAAKMPEWHVLIDANPRDSGRVFRFEPGAPKLEATLPPQSVIYTTTMREGCVRAAQAFEDAMKHASKLTREQLKEPSGTKVFRIPESRLRKSSESHIPCIKEFFAGPVAKMTITDPYLNDEERIVNRLGEYIKLAVDGKKLEKVYIITRDAGRVQGGDHSVQTKAFEKLRKRFSDLDINIRRETDNAMHDRHIVITRADGSTAAMYLGRGLDFIRADGSVQATYIVVEER